MPLYRTVDKNFFKEWSGDMAYTLGFFFADGSMDITSRGACYLSFHSCDREIVEQIRTALRADHKIATRKRNTPRWQVGYRMQIGSKEMYKDLQAFGLERQKASQMGMPHVPHEYVGDFVRGYFDGDGNVWMGTIHKERRTTMEAINVAFTSASHKFLDGLQGCLKSRDISGRLSCKENFYRLSCSIYSSLKLYDLMYNEAQGRIHLARKRIVFEEYKRMREVRS